MNYLLYICMPICCMTLVNKDNNDCMKMYQEDKGVSGKQIIFITIALDTIAVQMYSVIQL
jgi:hypothetical protein